ncbi:major facilitator superfamily domain-containing protein [Copromyces sp. CBS 386.78]|nr:major facilitator superfamily domain-containing protein [Copromyces sp. CBS 386.78]
MAPDQSKGQDDITLAPVHEEPTIRIARDKATDFLASHADDGTCFTSAEEKAVLRRIDLRVLPLLLGAYFFQQLDKSSLSYVSIFGITDDAHLVGKQYSWLGSILYLAQLFWQPAAACILVKLPTGKVIGAAIFLWGCSLAIMSACTDFKSLLGMRFVLGSFEAMIAPSCVAVTQMWWRRSEQTLRTSYWNAMNGVTFIVGSLFTYGLGHIHSEKMFRYQLIFLVCGLLTVLYSVVVLIFMPDSPMGAKYLRQREKVIAVERLRANQMGVASRTWRWDHVVETLLDLSEKDTKLTLGHSIASGGIGTFGNLIVKSFGYSSFETILFNIPFGVIQVVAIVGTGWFATRFQRKGLVIAGVSVLPTIGTILMLTVSREHKGVLLLGYYLVSCIGTHGRHRTREVTPRRSARRPWCFIGMCTGNVIGPLLYSTDHAPLYRPGLIADLTMFVQVGALSALIPFYLMFLNRRHARRREELGKTADVVDESMVAKSQLETSKAVEVEEGGVAGAHGHQQRSLEEDNALQDMTDLRNEDFIFVY